jgi:VanZ family protein
MTTWKSFSLTNWLNAYLPPILWACVIFAFSAQTNLQGAELSVLDFLIKKCAHMFVYGVLYLLFYRAIQLSSPSKDTAWSWILPLLFCFGYAISDEFHQSLVPGRYASPRDIGYDMLGALLVWLKIYNYI